MPVNEHLAVTRKDIRMVIRDPVHGDLYFTEIERRIIDTRQMQRLRGIRQTGSAYLVYPGCVHTRFEHSLGTTAITRKIVGALRTKGEKIDSDQEAAISLAALVHDVSHLPFGHTFEDERKLFPRHDTVERLEYFLSQNELGQTLESSGYRETVFSLLTDPHFSPPWMRQIINSTIDADLLDYLRRDAYFSGLQQNYDDRIFSNFILVRENLAIDLTKLSTRTELLHLLRLRYFLTERIYYHHAKVASGAMIAKALELAIELGVTEQDLYDLTDDTLLQFLLLIGDPRINQHIQSIKNRRLLKRAYVLSTAEIGIKKRNEFISTYNNSIETRQLIEKKIADAAVIDPSQVILYCSDLSSIKEARVYVQTRQGLHRFNEPMDNPPFDVKSVEDHYEQLWKLYVFAPGGHRERVGRICESLFEAETAAV